MLIVWNEMHRTGIPILDEQHRGIVSVINSLFWFMRGAQAIKVMLPTVTMIEQYTKIHFLAEEDLLRRSGWPKLEPHMRLHTKLIEHMLKVSQRVRESHDPTELLEFLKSWWTEHINEQDHLYIEHLREWVRKNPGPDSPPPGYRFDA